MNTRKKILIVGGGFGGLQVAKTLANKDAFEVTLIDRRNYHLFQPLLYQVAMAGLSPAEIAMPIRSILSQAANIRVLLGNVQSVDFESKTVRTEADTYSYDSLVLACGANHSYFGHDEWESFAPGLKTLEQATEIRRRVLTAFEQAERNPAERERLLTFVVVGGGPTGVELAGALGEISRFTLSRDFRHIEPGSARVLLIEGGPRILPTFDPELSKSAESSLKELGVSVLTASLVTDIREDAVKVQNEWIPAGTILWASGVAPSSLNGHLGTPLDERKRVLVGADLSLPHHPEVFVIGDQAHAKDKTGRPLPGLAPVALQQGKFVGELLIRESEGLPRGEFRYLDKGQMATIGRKMAVMEFRKTKATGFFAWMAWLLVHIFYLIGFRNRVFVLLQWMWHYVTYGRGARLIVEKEWRLHPTSAEKHSTPLPPK